MQDANWLDVAAMKEFTDDGGGEEDKDEAAIRDANSCKIMETTCLTISLSETVHPEEFGVKEDTGIFEDKVEAALTELEENPLTSPPLGTLVVGNIKL